MAWINSMTTNNVYNYYLTTYAPKSTSPYDTHKKSELRKIYNNIVKQAKDSPIYFVDTSKETQQYAVDIKENARALKNVISSLSDTEKKELLNKKFAISSDEEIVSASFVGSLSENSPNPSLDIEVQRLASPQWNVGNYLPKDRLDLPPGDYSFDIETSEMDYEFQFTVHNSDTNGDIQSKLARLINKSNIGIQGSIEEDGEGNRSLHLKSSKTGEPESELVHFHVTDENTTHATGMVEFLGIDHVAHYPQNAVFVLDGEEGSSYSNTFTVDKTFELTLKGINREGESTHVGIKPDVESFSENISHLIMGYNSFIQRARAYESNHPKSRQLLGEMNRLVYHYYNELASVGLSLENNGTLSMDKNYLEQSVSENNAPEKLTGIKNFTNSLLKKSDQISLNPMDYVDKILVAYKNPGKNFSNPYMTCMYSGMMFNSYC
ncbi:flagellar capping protein [bacterium 1XD42-8]|jgi:flagellar hook-associated protein 2|nr:flagellar capping protein [Lachnospiraceae bacterium]RKJ47326.1 flagellar capping protein [bacterium 1XD42-8]